MPKLDIPTFSAAPGVLISVPQLRDPNFARSVVLMLLHSDEGAFGLVINQETPLHCAELVESFGLDWPGSPEDKVLRGGPVDPAGVWLAHDADHVFEDSLSAGQGIVTSRSREALDTLCEDGARPLLVGVGCAGWGPGQLESEIAAGAWICAPTSVEMVFEWPREHLWKRALDTLGIDPAHLVTGGGLQ